MNDNKKKLQEIKYKLYKCCGLCAEFQRSHQTPTFGTCVKDGYGHVENGHMDNGEYAEPPSPLSVTAFGGCPDWSRDPYKKVAVMIDFDEFSDES